MRYRLAESYSTPTRYLEIEAHCGCATNGSMPRASLPRRTGPSKGHTTGRFLFGFQLFVCCGCPSRRGSPEKTRVLHARDACERQAFVRWVGPERFRGASCLQNRRGEGGWGWPPRTMGSKAERGTADKVWGLWGMALLSRLLLPRLVCLAASPHFFPPHRHRWGFRVWRWRPHGAFRLLSKSSGRLVAWRTGQPWGWNACPDKVVQTSFLTTCPTAILAGQPVRPPRPSRPGRHPSQARFWLRCWLLCRYLSRYVWYARWLAGGRARPGLTSLSPCMLAAVQPCTTHAPCLLLCTPAHRSSGRAEGLTLLCASAGTKYNGNRGSRAVGWRIGWYYTVLPIIHPAWGGRPIYINQLIISHTDH